MREREREREREKERERGRKRERTDFFLNFHMSHTMLRRSIEFGLDTTRHWANWHCHCATGKISTVV